jgi:hypothetical protein
MITRVGNGNIQAYPAPLAQPAEAATERAASEGLETRPLLRRVSVASESSCCPRLTEYVGVVLDGYDSAPRVLKLLITVIPSLTAFSMIGDAITREGARRILELVGGSTLVAIGTVGSCLSIASCCRSASRLRRAKEEYRRAQERLAGSV